MDKVVRSRAWCFTHNNYKEEDLEKWAQSKYKYLVFGQEVGEKGTKHLQGYIEFENAKTLSALKKKWPTVHFEQRRGTPEEAAAYCKKDNSFFENGEISHQGKRTDIHDLVAAVSAGLSDKDLIDEGMGDAVIRYGKGIDRVRLAMLEDRREPPECWWVWGATGIGKTKMCFEAGQKIGPKVYIKDGTQWWDNYDGKSPVIIDDFDGKWPIRDLLRLLDRYPYQAQVKGGYVKVTAPLIMITCDRPMEWIYEDMPRELQQLKRRFTEHGKIIELKDPSKTD